LKGIYRFAIDRAGIHGDESGAPGKLAGPASLGDTLSNGKRQAERELEELVSLKSSEISYIST
jgi:hypothetical protein